MSETESFLEQILQHPDADSPRLIYADWLEERGNSDRAEFIRLQCERAALPFWDERYLPIRAREEELLENHFAEWTADLPQHSEIRWGRFRRGFLAEAEFSTMRGLRQHLADCTRVTPLESISLLYLNELKGIEEIRPVSSLREFNVGETDFFSGLELERFAGAPVLSTIRKLTLNGCAAEAASFREFLQSPFLFSLQSLKVPNNYLGNKSIEAITDPDALMSARIRELDLSENGYYADYHEDPNVNDEGLQMLAAWKGIRHLQSLKLSGNDLGRKGLRPLLQAATKLSQLTLRRCGLSEDDMEAFADAKKIQLRWLDLGHNPMDQQGIETLMSSRCVSELECLHLNRCEVTETATKAIAGARCMETLRRLDLGDNEIRLGGLQSLLNHRPEHLHTLLLENNGLGEAGVKEILQSELASKLQVLSLDRNDLDDYAVEMLKDAENLGSLHRLTYKYNRHVSQWMVREFTNSELGKRTALFDDVAKLEFDDGMEA